MRSFRILFMVALLITATGLCGCGGGGAEVKSHTRTTTLGQELTDLEAAYKKGVITKEQYEASKEKLLEKE